MPKNKTELPLIEKLETLCEGLVYTSEIDSEMTPFVGEKVPSASTNDLLAAIAKSDTEIDEIEIDEFFANLTAEYEWLNEAERRQSKRFAKLEKFLKDKIKGPRVFRFGETRVDIYVAGIGPDGRVTGVRTKAVET